MPAMRRSGVGWPGCAENARCWKANRRRASLMCRLHTRMALSRAATVSLASQRNRLRLARGNAPKLRTCKSGCSGCETAARSTRARRAARRRTRATRMQNSMRDGLPRSNPNHRRHLHSQSARRRWTRRPAMPCGRRPCRSGRPALSGIRATTRPHPGCLCHWPGSSSGARRRTPARFSTWQPTTATRAKTGRTLPLLLLSATQSLQQRLWRSFCLGSPRVRRVQQLMMLSHEAFFEFSLCFSGIIAHLWLVVSRRARLPP
mmetsp:Transcript_70678/g.178900  ORF Transcript_70678/g.178900 Transcript_70678/m.178900 type:complete len:261 (-) Transcript_70678:1444-2226(-)